MPSLYPSSPTIIDSAPIVVQTLVPRCYNTVRTGGDMYITDDGIRLNATLDMPAGNPAKCPIAIVIHGFTGNSEETHIVAVSKMFNELGLATLRVDMYGHGKSDGQFRDHTLFKWMDNAMAVIDYARKLDFVTDIYLCGHSQGGLTVMLTAGLENDRIKGLIPLSPATVIPEGARRGMILGMPFDPERIPEEYYLERKDLTLGGNYARVAQTIHVEEAMDRYKGPVLLVHGDADETVPLQCSVDAAARYADAELKIIHGDTHCYDNHLDQMVAAVKEWMEKQLAR